MKKILFLVAFLSTVLLPDSIANNVKTSRHIVVAASNTCRQDKKLADFVCTGTHDEATINKAVEKLTFGGTIQLLDGDYYIDSFENEGNSAICFGYNDGKARAIDFVGTTHNKGYNTMYGVCIHVSQAAYDSMDPEQTYRIFYGTQRIPENDVFYAWTHINNLYFENFKILIPGAQKKIISIDCRNFGNGSMKRLVIGTEKIDYERFAHIKPQPPVEGCIGVYSVGSSNEGALGIGYDGICINGMHTGFVCHGIEHLIMTDCAACRCVVGYEFRDEHKVITMINCCDEGNTYLPRFYGNGILTCLDFNIERLNAAFIPDDPSGEDTHYAKEDTPLGWHGIITYMFLGNAFGVDDFWAEGSGKNFKTINLKKDACEWPL